MNRYTMSPISTSPAVLWNPRVEKGIRNSAVHPSPFCTATTSQYESQLSLMMRSNGPSASLAIDRSVRAPVGLVANHRPVS